MSTSKAEQAVAFAALILVDDSIAITPEKLQALLKSAGVEDVEPIWTTLFAKALQGKDVKDVLTTVQAGRPGYGGPVTNEKLNEKDNEVPNEGEKDKDGIGLGEGSGDEEDFGFDLFG